MRQDGIGMACFDKLERGPSVVAGNGLVPEPHDRAVGIAGQLLGRGKNMHDRLEAFLNQGQLRPLRERIAMHVRQLGEVRERQAQAATQALGRHEVPFVNVGKQGGQHLRRPMCVDRAYIALLAHFEGLQMELHQERAAGRIGEAAGFCPGSRPTTNGHSGSDVTLVASSG